MKKQKNILCLFLALIPCVQTFMYADNSTTMAIPRTSNFHIPDDMPMPSVDDLFGNMTEEQIVQQIQEAQKLFESLSPEEMEEFAKIVDETWAKMPSSDKEAIQDIANMVKPYFPEEEPQAKQSPVTEEPVITTKKPVVKENNSIQALIDNINALIDDVLQKISSNKDLVEEFTTKWASKFTFDNLKRQILALKEDRLADKLVAKINAEDKELAEKLEEFYKNLKTKNEPFYVEDTFGLPSSSKAQDAKQLKQAKEILAVFDQGIDEVMPKIEKFLKKHDPEALEMAKESAERAKRAQAHAKDASIKRGSAAAPLAPEPTRKTTTAAQPATSSAASYNQNYYDSYAPYGGGYGGYGNSGNYGYGSGSGYDYPSANAPQADNKSTVKKDETKKEEPKKSDEKKDDSKKKKEITPYDQAIDELEGYFDVFDNKAHEKFLKFLQKDLSDYPDATINKGVVTNPNTKQEWLYGTGQYAGKGFKTYTNNISSSLNLYADNLDHMQNASDAIEKIIPLMQDADLKKLAENKSIKQMQDRLKNYSSLFNDSYDKIKLQQTANLDPVQTFLTDSYLTDYQKFHNDFEQILNVFKKNLSNSDLAIQSMNKKIKRYQRKNKTAAEKEAQKANQFGF